MYEELGLVLGDALDAHFAARDLVAIWPNKDAPDALPVEYVEVDLLPAEPFVRGVTTGWAIHTVLVQATFTRRAGAITVNGERQDGDGPLYRHIDALARAFPVGRRLLGPRYTFTILKAAWPGPSLPSDGRFALPSTMTVQVIA